MAITVFISWDYVVIKVNYTCSIVNRKYKKIFKKLMNPKYFIKSSGFWMKVFQ